MTGPGETVDQIVSETRLVVDCKVNATQSVGHVKTTFAPDRIIVSCGNNERLNTVPLAALPPPLAVPYRVLFDKIKLFCRGCLYFSCFVLVVFLQEIPPSYFLNR